MVEEEKAYARSEIESARAAMQRIEQALHEQDQMSGSMEKQVLFPFKLFTTYFCFQISGKYPVVKLIMESLFLFSYSQS